MFVGGVVFCLAMLMFLPRLIHSMMMFALFVLLVLGLMYMFGGRRRG